VTTGEEARIREACVEDLVGACTEELLAQPDAAPAETADEWWPNPGEDPLGQFSHVTVSYRGVPAVVDISFRVPHGAIVALIGPSGSGKSSLIRCMNRLNDLVPGAETQGELLYRDVDLYGPGVDAVEVRAADGRTGVGAGPDQHLPDRGPDARAGA
jgi:ABC-type multidrug transport system fused ATPase/permease subunit